MVLPERNLAFTGGAMQLQLEEEPLADSNTDRRDGEGVGRDRRPDCQVFVHHKIGPVGFQLGHQPVAERSQATSANSSRLTRQPWSGGSVVSSG